MARGARPRVFLDTNVIFSALRSSAGPPADIMRFHIEGNIQMVVSRQVRCPRAGRIATGRR